MKKLYLIAMLLLFATGNLVAQNQNNNWNFGNYIGINFNSSLINGFQFYSGSQMVAPKSSASVSDPVTGQLLFYTNGRTIWNKNNLIMSNGDNLLGCPSAAQPVIILSKPGSNTIYYVFTISGINLFQTGVPERKGLSYSIVDMALDSGFGSVSSKNNLIFTNSDTEMLTSTLGNDGSFIWVVTQKEANFLSYKLTAAGVDTNPIISPAIRSATGVSGTRSLKISPNSNLIAARYEYNNITPNTSYGLTIYNFNNSTGIVSNPMTYSDDYAVSSNDITPVNGVEFSPDSRYIYVGIREACFCLGYSFRDKIKIYETSSTFSSGQIPLSAYQLANLQLGKDNKIYVALYTLAGTNNNVGYIENPNIPATSIFTINTPINTIVSQGLPQLVQISSEPICQSNLTLNQIVVTNSDFRVSNLITANNAINNNLNVNFRSKQTLLKPGFFVTGNSAGKFRAFYDPCGFPSSARSLNNNESNPDITKAILEKPVKVIAISPNPNNGIFKISLNEVSEGKIEISDLYGFTVYKTDFKNQTDFEMNMQDRPKGIYIIKVFSGEQVFTSKIIKN